MPPSSRTENSNTVNALSKGAAFAMSDPDDVRSEQDGRADVVGVGVRVDQVGHRVGLPRATLARRFTVLVGRPPPGYLTDWRMELAAHRLRSTRSRSGRSRDPSGARASTPSTGRSPASAALPQVGFEP